MWDEALLLLVAFWCQILDAFIVLRWAAVAHMGLLFSFLSETSERNSSKLDRKQDLNVPYQAKQKYRGMFETQKPGDKTSSGEIGLNIITLASPKVGQDYVFGGVNVPVGMPHPYKCSLENLAQGKSQIRL